MMVMTAKVNKKKILLALITAAIVLGAFFLVTREPEPAQPTAAAAGNDSRIAFLKKLGWQPVTTPKESCQVSIPSEPTPVFQRYNALQKQQGYDLSAYAGKNVMRYVYELRNYPGATAPVYATLLVYKGQIIGGDITDTAAKGAVQGLQRAAENAPLPAETGPESTGS